MLNHSYENEFNLHVNEISFSYERMSTKTRFEKEAKGNSEMTYLHIFVFQLPNLVRCNVMQCMYMKIIFHVWNLIMLKKITKLFASLCMF